MLNLYFRIFNFYNLGFVYRYLRLKQVWELPTGIVILKKLLCQQRLYNNIGVSNF